MKTSDKNFKAVRLFVDRVKPTQVFNDCCDEIFSGKNNKILLSFYGYGGVGKSKFFEELQNACKKKDSIDFTIIGLNTYEYNNVLSILLAIRRKMEVSISKFDYAVVQYYYKNGLPYVELEKKFAGVKSNIMSIIGEISMECADAFVPILSYVFKAASISKKIKEIISDLYKEKKFADIEKMSAHDILMKMPEYLAEGFDNSKKLPIIAFDDYESMINKLDKCSLCDNCHDWIINFISHIKKAIVLFASREKLCFEDQLRDIVTIKEFFLEHLSNADSEKFLRGVPILEEDIIQDILKVSKGIPLYLDMCVDIYEKYKTTDDKFDLSKLNVDGIVNRYLSHFNNNESDVIKLLSLIGVFESDFVSFLIKEMNFLVSDLEVDQMLEKCIFNNISDDWYKVDTTIKNVLALHITDKIRLKMANILIAYIKSNNRCNNLVAYFESLCNIVNSISQDSIRPILGNIIDVSNDIMDKGYWSETYNVVKNCLKKDEFSSLVKYVSANDKKRSGKLADALKLIKEISINKNEFGNFRFSIDLLEAQIKHLLGDYHTAKEKYTSIVDQMDDFDLQDDDSRTYTLALLKLCDLDMLFGKFEEARKKLKKIDYKNNPSLESEARRIKAHIYRFNLNYEKSNELYLFAMDKCKDIKSRGALFNNLAETNCIKYPLQTIEYAKQSLEINESICAKIEIGKTYCAISIAYTQLGDYNKAIEYSNKAKVLQNNTGYKAGVLFALFAEAFYYYKIKANEKFYKILEEMEKIVAVIKVYGFLVSFFKVFCNTPRALDGYEWIDIDATNKELEEMKK